MAEYGSAFRCELIGDEISDIDVLENNIKINNKYMSVNLHHSL